MLPIVLSYADPSSEGSGTLSLRTIASQKNKKMGAAVTPSYFSETGYTDTLAKEFNTVVAENCMKWTGFHKADNSYDYSEADSLVSFADANNMFIRGHCFVWNHPSHRPAWLESKAADYDGKPGSELENKLREHIDNAIAHFGNKVFAWDVVNEPIIDPWANPVPDYAGSHKGLRNKTRNSTTPEYSFWAKDENDDYLLKKAFEFADEKLTKLGIRNQVKLFANDYSNEEAGSRKGDQFFELVQSWVLQGVPIDGAGFQLHSSFQFGMPDYMKIRSNIERFAALKPGFEVHFTEIDIGIHTPAGVSGSELDNQANAYESLAAICRDYPEVTAFLVWGITDLHSWLNASDYRWGLLFDSSYAPKPGYYSVKNALSQSSLHGAPLNAPAS